MYKYEKELLSLDKTSGTYQDNLTRIETELNERITELKRQKQIALYPLLSASDESLNIIGEAQRNDAIMFLSEQRDSIAVKDKVIHLLETAQFDAASFILEMFVPDIPKSEAAWFNLDSTAPDKVKLYRFIYRTYKTYSERRGIDLIEQELKKINELLTELTIKKEEAKQCKSMM